MGFERELGHMIARSCDREEQLSGTSCNKTVQVVTILTATHPVSRFWGHVCRARSNEDWELGHMIARSCDKEEHLSGTS